MTSTQKHLSLAAVTAVILSTVLLAQTKITAPKNKYSVADDVKLGKEAADEVRKQLPLIQDDSVSSYTADLGRKLAAAIPAEYAHAEFQYTFQTVNVREINAFALPGGPMFVNRGMIEAANAEGEVVGVMAHEMSHVMLRHGTANMTKASSPLGILGGIAGAAGQVFGGWAGAGLKLGSASIGMAFLSYSRDYEKQADILGAQLMSRAGYDARDMANMFKTIEKEGKSGPQFLSDHPNPGNRVQYITKEAESLHVDNPVHASAAFDRVRAHLKEMPKAPTTVEATKSMKSAAPAPTSASPRANDAPPTGRAPAPSSSYRSYTEGNVFQISVPSNWDELPEGSSVTFAPRGGYGGHNGQSVFTHGVQLGIASAPGRDLQSQTTAFLDSLRQGNPQMSRPSAYQRATISGRSSLLANLDNISEVTGAREVVQIHTTTMRDGSLFYAIFVIPNTEYNGYRAVFQRVVSSIRLAN